MISIHKINMGTGMEVPKIEGRKIESTKHPACKKQDHNHPIWNISPTFEEIARQGKNTHTLSPNKKNNEVGKDSNKGSETTKPTALIIDAHIAKSRGIKGFIIL